MSVVSPDMGEDGWTFDKDDGLDRRRRQRQEQAVRNLSRSPIRAIPAASACRCCGTRSARPSSTTNRPKSSACSIRRSTPSPTCAPIIIRQRCAPRSTASTSWSIRTSTTASIAPASPPRRRPTRRPSATCSTRSTRWSSACRGSAILPATQITEADWRLFSTLIRFDAVYYCHFKCNWRHISEYPNLSNYLRDLYQVPGVAETVNLDHIKRHYYGSQRQVNPTGIVPLGPAARFRRAARPRAGSARRRNFSARILPWPSPGDGLCGARLAP